MVRGPFLSSSTIPALVALLFFLISAIPTPTIAFTTIAFTTITTTATTTTTTTPNANSNSNSNCNSNSIVLFSSSSASTTPDGSQKPDLVDQTLFRAAIDRVNDEIEAQYKAQKIAEGTATEEPTEEEQEWLAEQAQAKLDNDNGDDDNKFVFLVGKLDAILPIDTQPELDLTESIGPLVLVTNVWGRTAEATGLQEFDTLTKVRVDDPDQPFCATTKCTTLEETAAALTAAAQHAIALGKTEINLEVQRLIKGYYAPEDSV